MPQPLDRARQGAHVTTGRKFNTTIDDKLRSLSRTRPAARPVPSNTGNIPCKPRKEQRTGRLRHPDRPRPYEHTPKHRPRTHRPGPGTGANLGLNPCPALPTPQRANNRRCLGSNPPPPVHRRKASEILPIENNEKTDNQSKKYPDQRQLNRHDGRPMSG